MKTFLEKNKIYITSLVIVAFLSSTDIGVFLNRYNAYINFKNNVRFIVNAINTTLPVIGIVVFIIIIIMFRKKWVFRIEKLSIGGASIEFDRPDAFFKRNIKNFLNTKRTLFKFDEERDNINDTIGSFYGVYTFIREQLKIYDPKSSESSECYKIANNMIYELNEFLTAHQDDYKRWYEYKKNENETHNENICDLQKKYRKYNYLVEDILELNIQFKEYAKTFDINTERWNNSKYKHAQEI